MNKVILRIWGAQYLMDEADAMKAFSIMQGAPQFYEYGDDTLTPCAEGNLSISSVSPELMDEIAAAKALGVPLYKYRQDSSK